MYKVNGLPNSIDIGYIGETNFRTIEIDMTPWLEENPDGIPSIVHIRPGETASNAYIANTTFSDGILSWVITAGDLGGESGYGTAQVWLEEEENDSVVKRGKSALFQTLVHASVGEPSSTVPSAQTAWLEAMTELKTQTVTAAESVGTAVEEAGGYAEDSEAWAVGQRGGEDVESTDPTYHNNSKYYAEEASSSATDAETAQDAAETAQGGAEDAEENAEAWAVGQRGGVDVGSEDPTYNNNSKYYAQQASSSATSAGNAQTAAETAQGKAEDAQEAAEAAQAASEAASTLFDDATAEATTVPYGDPAKATITTVGGAKKFSFEIPAGPPGPAVGIDDTAGAGDTSKTWSADKHVTELAKKADLSNGKLDTTQIPFDAIYPVGSIYMSVSNTSPATLFGGTWEQLKDQFLLGAGDTYSAGTTGGAATESYTPAGSVDSHTLTTDEIPSHNHSFTGSSVTSGNNSVGHTHGLNGHKHSVGGHSHGLNGHVHSGPSHSHVLDGSALKKNSSTLVGNGGTPSMYATTWIDSTNNGGTGNTGGNSGSTANNSSFDTGGNSGNTGGISANHTHSVTASGSIGSTGGGGGHTHGFTGTAATLNIMPPYLTVYMWKRTA